MAWLRGCRTGFRPLHPGFVTPGLTRGPAAPGAAEEKKAGSRVKPGMTLWGEGPWPLLSCGVEGEGALQAADAGLAAPQADGHGFGDAAVACADEFPVDAGEGEAERPTFPRSQRDALYAYEFAAGAGPAPLAVTDAQFGNLLALPLTTDLGR